MPNLSQRNYRNQQRLSTHNMNIANIFMARVLHQKRSFPNRLTSYWLVWSTESVFQLYSQPPVDRLLHVIVTESVLCLVMQNTRNHFRKEQTPVNLVFHHGREWTCYEDMMCSWIRYLIALVSVREHINQSPSQPTPFWLV